MISSNVCGVSISNVEIYGVLVFCSPLVRSCLFLPPDDWEVAGNLLAATPICNTCIAREPFPRIPLFVCSIIHVSVRLAGFCIQYLRGNAIYVKDYVVANWDFCIMM